MRSKDIVCVGTWIQVLTGLGLVHILHMGHNNILVYSKI